MYDRVTLIGCGLIGSSIAHAVKRHGLASHLSVVEKGGILDRVRVLDVAQDVTDDAAAVVKDADLVIWNPAFFGVKPDFVLLGGSIAMAPMGDPNASIPTPQPVHYRPMFAAYGKNRTSSSVTFVSQASLDAGLAAKLGVAKQLVAVRNTRGGIGKASMIHNSLTPHIEVDPETYEVRADGELLTCEPATIVPMAQRYFLF